MSRTVEPESELNYIADRRSSSIDVERKWSVSDAREDSNPERGGPGANASNAARSQKEKSPSVASDQFLAKVAKFVPSELVAPYLAISGILLTSSDLLVKPVGICCYVLFQVYTPIYMYRISKRELRSEKVCRIQAAMSSIAFLVWAYSIGGIFSLLGWHRPFLASILLILFSVASGMVPVRDASRASGTS